MTVKILLGDVRAKLRELPADSVHTVVTSPPYWALRDYGVPGQLGLEPTPQEHVAAMVAVFEEVKRVLRPDGVCFVNYGDSYAGAINGRSAADTKAAGGDDRTFRDKPVKNVTGGLKEKDLCLVPERFVLAMQEAGWWVRSRFPWLKRNSMPESITDRPATATEYFFMFTKNAGRRLWWRHLVSREWTSEKPEQEYQWRNLETRELVAAPPPGWEHARTTSGQRRWARIAMWEGFDYWYDADAVRRAMAPSSIGRLAQDIDRQAGSTRANGGAKTNGTMKAVRRPGNKERKQRSENGGNPAHASNQCYGVPWEGDDRNFRNADLFFDSLEPAHGLMVDADGIPLGIDVTPQPFRQAHFATFPPKLIEPLIKAGCPKGGTVLDPFGGAGTTGLVADRLQRNAILIELNPEYAAIAEKRINGDAPLLATVAAE